MVRRWTQGMQFSTLVKSDATFLSILKVDSNFSLLQAGGHLRAKVVISAGGIIMENLEEPSFFEAKLNLSLYLSLSLPLSRLLFVLYASAPPVICF